MFQNKDSTIITISHRKNSIKSCNKIYELNQNMLKKIDLNIL